MEEMTSFLKKMSSLILYPQPLVSMLKNLIFAPLKGSACEGWAALI
jgi:hypothetical protein